MSSDHSSLLALSINVTQSFGTEKKTVAKITAMYHTMDRYRVFLFEENGGFCSNFHVKANYVRLNKSNMVNWSKSRGTVAFGHYAATIAYILEHFRGGGLLETLPNEIDVTDSVKRYTYDDAVCVDTYPPAHCS
jgi:hypothetical protein